MNTYHVYNAPAKRYGFWGFMRDCLGIVLTGGLWLIWIFIREMRRRG